MKYIKVAKAIFMVMTIMFISYNTYYGWNMKPESPQEEWVDRMIVIFANIALIIYLWPLKQRYEKLVKRWSIKTRVMTKEEMDNMFKEMDAQPLEWKTEFSFRNLYGKHQEWSDKTFGYNRSPIGPLKHMEKEINEVIADPKDEMEYADLLLLLIDAHRNGTGKGPDNLIRLAYQKLEINKQRKWGAPDENGTVEHDRSED